MILSKYGKSYDTSNGSEQSHAATRPGKAQAGEHGGPPDVEPPVLSGDKPAWSVLPLCDLNEAIQREFRQDAPARLRQASERRERLKHRALEINADAAATAARFERDRDRNAWEHT